MGLANSRSQGYPPLIIIRLLFSLLLERLLLESRIFNLEGESFLENKKSKKGGTIISGSLKWEMNNILSVVERI